MHGIHRALVALAAGVCTVGAVPAAAGAQGGPPLLESVRAGEVQTARSLVASGADVDATQGDGATALHWAAHRDDLEAADLLISAGADANVANQLGATPLWLAAINGSASMAERLLAAGADPNAPLRMGETPLMTAARSGDVATVALLLEHGAAIDAAEQERGQTALMWAAAQGHTDVVRMLIESGANIDARSKVWRQLENTAGNTNPSGNFEMEHGGSTPLLFVARNGHVETARVLIEAGADVDDIEASGASALVIAAHSGHGPLGIYLLESGANPNAALAGYSALHAAVLRGRVELVTALLDHGAYPNALVEHGTPGRRFSADFSIRSQLIGTNPLWLAAKYGEPEILRILAERGAQQVPSQRGEVPVLQAAMGMPGSSLENRRDRIANAPLDPETDERITLELANIILELGADVNATDGRGTTALHQAVLKDFPAVVEFLASRGADINIEDSRGRTPLDLAETPQTIPSTNGLSGTRPEVAEVLRRLGANE